MRKLIIMFFVIGCVILVQVGYGETNQPQPGSADDPLITKGYVDQQMTLQINSKTDQIRTELNQMILTNVTQSVQTEITKQSQDQVLNFINEQIAKNTTYQLVSVPPGQIIVFNGGAEVIVRAGKAVIVSPDKNGISDLSDGTDKAPNTLVSNNHLLLFPRTGRGLQIDSNQKSVTPMLVRGTFEIRNSLISSTPAPTATTIPSPVTTIQ